MGDAIDPVRGMDGKEEEAAAGYEFEGRTYYFWSLRCKEKFSQDPDKFIREEGE